MTMEPETAGIPLQARKHGLASSHRMLEEEGGPALRAALVWGRVASGGGGGEHIRFCCVKPLSSPSSVPVPPKAPTGCAPGGPGRQQ